MLSYTISNYGMSQFWRGLTQSRMRLLFLYDSQEMQVALVKKQIRAESGSLTQNPAAHIRAHYNSMADSSGLAGVLSTISAQTIENHDSR